MGRGVTCDLEKLSLDELKSLAIEYGYVQHFEEAEGRLVLHQNAILNPPSLSPEQARVFLISVIRTIDMLDRSEMAAGPHTFMRN